MSCPLCYAFRVLNFPSLSENNRHASITSQEDVSSTGSESRCVFPRLRIPSNQRTYRLFGRNKDSDNADVIHSNHFSHHNVFGCPGLDCLCNRSCRGRVVCFLTEWTQLHADLKQTKKADPIRCSDSNDDNHNGTSLSLLCSPQDNTTKITNTTFPAMLQ